MKRILFTLLAGMFCGVLLSQDHIIADYFAEQAKDPTFEKMEIKEKTFDLISKIKAKDQSEQNVITAIKKLNGVLAIHKNLDVEESRDLFNERVRDIKSDNNYEELVAIQTENEQVLFLIREEKEIVKELSLIVQSNHEFFVATLFGELDIANLLKMGKVIQKDRKDWFEFFNAVESDALVFGNKTATQSQKPGQNSMDISELDVRISPNPADKFVRIEALGAADATFDLSFYSLLGKELKTINKVALPHTLSLEDLPSGAYFIRLTNAEGKYRNFRVVKP